MNNALLGLGALAGAAIAAGAASGGGSAGKFEWANLPIPDVVLAEVPVSDNAWGNLMAFLAVIRAGESSDNYRALVGGGNFSSWEKHPAELGWAGIRRGDDGRLTTAAGGYQITRTTYRDLGGSSFDPESQDRLAIRLLIRRGAYGAVLAGNVEAAVAKLPNEWEMFKLPRWNVDRVASVYQSNGGFVA